MLKALTNLYLPWVTLSSMLVGIRIIPKAPQQEEFVSPESSRRGSMSSRGSDADNSNLDSSSGSEDEGDGDTLETNGSKGDTDLSRRLDKLWKSFLKELGDKAQDALREVTSLGEGVMTLSGIHKRSSSSSSGRIETLAENDSEGRLPAVELKPVHSSSSRPSTKGKESKKKGKGRDGDKVKGKGKGKGRGKGKDGDEGMPSTDMNGFDPDSFQTVRHAPRTPDAGGYGSRRPALPGMVELTSGSGHQAHQQQNQYHHPSMQQGDHQSFSQQQQPIWSKGMASEGLPDGFEVVYYFGLIDILQKYNLVKWFEKNLKGANVRLLGGGGGPTGAVQNSVPLAHPGRSTPSTSIPGSSLYQLSPQASTSEPSLPSTFQSTPPTHTPLSVLLEDSRSNAAGLSHDNGSTERLPLSSSDLTRSSLTSTRLRATHLDPSSSSSTFSSARLSQEESTLNPLFSEDTSSSSLHSSSTSSSSTSNPYPTGAGKSHQQHQQSRLSTSAPFSKSIARLSQQSHYSHLSGRSRDSRLSFEIRENESMSSSPSAQPLSGSPSTGNGFLSVSPPSIGIQPPQQEETAQQLPKTTPVHQYQMPQHAEVSVEEPGRYAERLIEFMRSVIV